MMNKVTTRNSIVAKSNTIIPYLSNYTLTELRLLSYCLAQLDSRSNATIDNRRTFALSIQDMATIYNLNPTSSYATIKSAIISIQKKPLILNTQTQKEIIWWFSSLTSYHQSDIIEFKLTSEICPYLLNLNNKFTLYRLENVYQFNSAHAWKLYELLKQWLTVKKKHFDLKELKKHLGIEDKYKQWCNFKFRILTPALSTINDISDIYASFTVTKTSRRVTGLNFIIESTPLIYNKQSTTTPEERVRNSLTALGVSQKVVEDYVNKAIKREVLHTIAQRLPKIQSLAKQKNIPVIQYVCGSILKIINNHSNYDNTENTQPPVADHQDALNCFLKKRKHGTTCTARARGTPGQRIKCQRCFDKIDPDLFCT